MPPILEQPSSLVAPAAPSNRRVPNFRLKVTRPERLLDAALQVFTRTGFEHGRMEDVARRAGITKPAIYNHFPSKHALIEAMIDWACLPDRPSAAEAPGPALEEALGEGSAAKVLELVLAERRTLPELGAHYLEALVKKLTRWPDVPGPDAAADIAAKALSAVSFRLLFVASDHENPAAAGH